MFFLNKYIDIIWLYEPVQGQRNTFLQALQGINVSKATLFFNLECNEILHLKRSQQNQVFNFDIIYKRIIQFSNGLIKLNWFLLSLGLSDSFILKKKDTSFQTKS